MNLPAPLIRGKLVKRYKRFFADVQLDTGDIVTAHCANPGAMLGLLEAGRECWVANVDNPKAKLRYRLELMMDQGQLIGVNTQRPNAIVEEALRSGRIEPFAHYETLKREVRYGDNSRIDFLLTGDGLADCYLEVKNVHYRVGQEALFPDSVTARGAKHMRELARMADEGHRAAVVYLVQRPDVVRVATAREIDPDYADACLFAQKHGVTFHACTCQVSTSTIMTDHSIDVTLS